MPREILRSREKENTSDREGSSHPRSPRLRVHQPCPSVQRPSSQSPLSPYTSAVSATRGENLMLGSLCRSSCFPSLAPDRFPSSKGVDEVLSEGWRCRAPVAARTLSSGFLPSRDSFFRSLLLSTVSRPCSVSLSLSLVSRRSRSRSPPDKRESVPLCFSSFLRSVLSEDVHAETVRSR